MARNTLFPKKISCIVIIDTTSIFATLVRIGLKHSKPGGETTHKLYSMLLCLPRPYEGTTTASRQLSQPTTQRALQIQPTRYSKAVQFPINCSAQSQPQDAHHPPGSNHAVQSAPTAHSSLPIAHATSRRTHLCLLPEYP